MEFSGPIKFANAYGDRNTGAHGTFGLFPPGFETPLHTHSASYRAIVVRGVMTNPFDGEAEPPMLTPRSYWEVEAGVPHTNACISAEPCEFFMYSDAAFDFAAEE